MQNLHYTGHVCFDYAVSYNHFLLGGARDVTGGRYRVVCLATKFVTVIQILETGADVIFNEEKDTRMPADMKAARISGGNGFSPHSTTAAGPHQVYCVSMRCSTDLWRSVLLRAGYRRGDRNCHRQ
jgi:hypothetical protein